MRSPEVSQGRRVHIRPRHTASRVRRRWQSLIPIGLACWLAACGTSLETRHPTASSATAASPVNAAVTPPPATSMPASPSQPTLAATIGKPADDGARVILVEAIDDRTRDITVDSPSVGVQKVRLLLPARFATEASTRWPVLYLLHGAGTEATPYKSWTTFAKVGVLTAPTNLLVVIPSAGTWGWYTDWWNDGA